MKKTIKNKYFLIGLILPLIIAGLLLYTYCSIIKHIEIRDKQIFSDAWEVGYMEGQIYQQNLIDGEKVSQEESDKTKLLKKLAALESVNGQKRKILDTNNKYSLGLFHFQARTVKDMYKRFYKQNISIQEAVAIAENDELATKLAHDAIFVHNEPHHWKISLCKLKVINKGCLTQQQINNLFAKK